VSTPKRATTPKRTEIADAALKVIGERGVMSLTIATLAAELGVTPGAPFRHFASRDEILEEVAARVTEILGAAFPDPSLPPLERLSRLFVARTEAVGKHAGIARLIFSDQFTKALPDTAAQQIRSIVKRTRLYLLEILKEAAHRGEIRGDVAPEDLVVHVMGTLQHLAFLGALPREGSGFLRPNPEHVLGTLVTLLQSK
jgi:AcrR family transcriptional regulator